ncbi:MAG: alkaline shock response membrane anchor protein AmaP [Pontiellaceae bacterium]|nr:alkaline shock response membrane anchor protein AmaP [Pontiellaceae bacterium]MBN2785740.1 alkaline shock response membrane anchor protein AmaP [Pontiellaceae bacterium]
MATWIKKALDIVVALLLLAMGCWLVYASWFDQATLESVLDGVKNSPFFSMAVGLLLILSFLLRMVVGSRSARKETYIDFQSDDGNVGISIQAIQDFVERIGTEFAAVKSIESKLVRDRENLDIVVGVRVLTGNKIPELSQVLQQRIRESVRESLGLEGIGKITVQVKEIIGAPEKAAKHDDNLTE